MEWKEMECIHVHMTKVWHKFKTKQNKKNTKMQKHKSKQVLSLYAAMINRINII